MILGTYPPLHVAGSLQLQSVCPMLASQAQQSLAALVHRLSSWTHATGAEGVQHVLPLYGGLLGQLAVIPAGCVPGANTTFDRVYPGAHQVSESYPQQSSSRASGECSRQASTTQDGAAGDGELHPPLASQIATASAWFALPQQ